MIHGVKDSPVDEHFTVADRNGNLISGIDSTAFTVYVYNPSDAEVSASVGVGFTELGNGNYKYTFTPDVNGIWYVVVTNPTYFPWGKARTFDVSENSLDTIGSSIARVLGLAQENYYLDQAIYNTYANKYKCLAFGRIRIYSDSSSVGTSSNVVATYQITATYNEPIGSEQPTLETYKVIKL